MSSRTAIGLVALGVLVPACNGGSRSSAAEDAGPAPSASVAAPSAPAPRERQDLIARLSDCEVRHRGFVLDLGTGAPRARRAFRVEPFEDVVDAEREGSTVARVMVPKISYEIPVDEAQEETEVSVRLRPGAARSVSATLGDRRLGVVKLGSGETKTLAFPVLKAALPAGRYTLTLAFAGRARGSNDALAEVDWIRVGTPDDASASYAAPTLRDLVADSVLDGEPRRAISLRAPASVRCRLLPSPDAAFKADIGFWGDGKGSLDVRVVSDGEAPSVLAERSVTGGQGATWTPLHLSLKDHASRVITLELRALETTKGGRILFGDPSLTRTRDIPRVPEASTVVLFVSAGTDRRWVPPWAPVGGLAAMAELSRASVAFSAYRVPSTVAGAVVGSLLTAEPPQVHALEDPAARLPKVARTLGELLKEASGRTAMFTAAPTTFAAFGFDAGWDKFVQVSPVQDVEATQPITSAARWLDDELGGEAGRRLLVIHARGAHPPWDVTKEEAALLPPEDYSGPIEPRRGGVALGRLRSQRRGQKKLGDDDWARLRGLVQSSLTKQDAALSQLINVLKKKGIWDSTLFVFVGDVAPGDAPETPFDPAGELGDDRLLVPLLVKFPGGKLATKEIHSAVTSVDVAATLLRALKLDPQHGSDLYSVAEGVEALTGRAQVASLGDRYSTRLGQWLLRGTLGKTPSLCQLDVDPACVNDVFALKPIAGWAAWQATSAAFSLGTSRRLAPREPASIDPDTGAALTVWGDI